MKPSIIVVLVLTLSALFAQAMQPATAETNQIAFCLCLNETATCRITVDSGSSSRLVDQDGELKLAQQLQTYIHKLSGVVLPVEGFGTRCTNDVIQNEIQFAIGSPPRFTYCYEVRFANGLTAKVGKTILVDANGLRCAQAAVSNFVEKVFGPPLSAIEDRNYQWPKRPTLAIDTDTFKTIEQIPREF
jgi:hypothetical protein